MDQERYRRFAPENLDWSKAETYCAVMPVAMTQDMLRQQMANHHVQYQAYLAELQRKHGNA